MSDKKDQNLSQNNKPEEAEKTTETTETTESAETVESLETVEATETVEDTTEYAENDSKYTKSSEKLYHKASLAEEKRQEEGNKVHEAYYYSQQLLERRKRRINSVVKKVIIVIVIVIIVLFLGLLYYFYKPEVDTWFKDLGNTVITWVENLKGDESEANNSESYAGSMNSEGSKEIVSNENDNDSDLDSSAQSDSTAEGSKETLKVEIFPTWEDRSADQEEPAE